MNKKIILSHPTGNANVRALANGLANAGILNFFYTTIASYPNNIWFKLSQFKALVEFNRRNYDACLEPNTKQYPWYEIIRVFATKFGFKFLLKHENGFFCVDRIYQTLDKKISNDLKKNAINNVSAIYAYEDGAAYSFQIAKQKQIKCLYELPTGYWRNSRILLNEEILRCPEWADTFTGFKDSEIKLKRKDDELALADYVFVASKFTASTLKEYPHKLPPVVVIPYGFPPVFENREYLKFDKKRRLRLLFVGKLTQQKGIADLFKAIIGLDNKLELTIVGHKSADIKILNDEIAKHNYIPSLPHDKVLELMRINDVLVFPSLFDGFGMVITEAMSQGTPVIATERSAGPDLIVHNENGWLVKAGAPLLLKQIIENLIESPDSIEKAGRAAMKTAKKRPWEVYEKEMAQCIKDIIQTNKEKH